MGRASTSLGLRDDGNTTRGARASTSAATRDRLPPTGDLGHDYDVIRLVLLAALVLATTAHAGGRSCDSLTALALPEATITAAALAPDGSYCAVRGTVPAAVRFEVWLPTTGWNGKFQGVGNGALAGFVNTIGMAAALRRGYATASTDTGHVGSPLDGAWALGRPDLVADFGHRGIHVTAVAAKAVVEAFYGTPPARSYFVGCSTGGKQGLTEAQRYPADYDGIVAGAPANFFTHLVVASNWVGQALHVDPASAIPPAKLPMIEAAMLDRCDARDGLRDGLIDDPRRCRVDPARLRCRGGDGPDCLTVAQVKALRKLYAGPRTSRGRRIYPGFVPGGEVGIGSDAGPAGDPNIGGWEAWLLNPTGLHRLIQETFFRYVVFEDPSWDWRTLDFDRDVRTMDAKVADVVNAVDPDLAAFDARGGKLLVWHGWSDPAIAALNSIAYYERVVAVTKRRPGTRDATDFVRLFMAPGMQHCAGGPGPNVFDAVGALERWVEAGEAPDRIVAEHRTAGVVDRTRPLCPYPEVAVHDGTGDPNVAESFACRRRRGPA